MKVAYVTMSFPFPSETFATTDVRALRQHGAEMTVHSLRPRHPDASRLLLDRNLEKVHMTHASVHSIMAGIVVALRRPYVFVQLLAFILRHTQFASNHFFKSLALVPRVLEVFKSIEGDQPDVVHIYWGHFPALVGHLVQVQFPQMVVSISLGAYDLEINYGGTGPVARRADLVRTLGHVNVKRIENNFGVTAQDITVIHDSVDLTRVRALSRAKGANDERISETKVRKRVLTAGRLKSHKGMRKVLEVFRDAVESHPDATLVVLGDGPDRPVLEALVEQWGLHECVHVAGHVAHDQVFREMADAEIFMLLSRGFGERLPNVVKEAMASGCVCIASDTPGMEELIPSTDYGFVVPKDAPRKALDRLMEIIDDPTRQEVIAERGRKHIHERFEVTTATAKYLRLWKRLVEAKSRKNGDTPASSKQERQPLP